MPMSSSNRVPVPTLGRLATYLRVLTELEQAHTETVSSADVEQQTGINAAQFRKDLSYFGEFGKPGVGYSVARLQESIAAILKIDRRQPVVLVGAGNLGSALIGYPGLTEHQMDLVAVFDNNPQRIGCQVRNLYVQDIQRFATVNETLQARIAILAVPAGAAQRVAEVLVAADVRAILNFAPTLLRLPAAVVVRNVSFMQELAVLSYHVSSNEQEENGEEQAGEQNNSVRPILHST